MVWLSPKNIKSSRPTKELSERCLGPFPIWKKGSTHAYHLKLPSTQSSTLSSWNQSRHKQSQIRSKSLLLKSSLKKKRNGKSLRYWIPRSREENYVIWWNGKVSFKTKKDPLANQQKTSRISLNLSRIFIPYILTSQDPILQELYYFMVLGAEKNYQKEVPLHVCTFGGILPFLL
ncbi:hypothetical protein O181_018244 [Austropuccinia psidii MF-1]|uniref:Tf2-1-like SH3-like domain-containing protein n=1 Tax=Austropuccinia psidii MF-1 TaxID=1389203 RepID=A0A9Q3C4Y0_9BASI|nr:hypothetical protein [Austropuccinia psidii MF-1]